MHKFAQFYNFAMEGTAACIGRRVSEADGVGHLGVN